MYLDKEKNILEDNPKQVEGIQQRDDKWKKYRFTKINASEVSNIMGINSYETKIWEFIQKKMFGIEKKDNKNIKHGQATELEALKFFEEILQKDNKISTFQKDNDNNIKGPVWCRGFMSASLDGWDSENKVLLEVKCPSQISMLQKEYSNWDTRWEKLKFEWHKFICHKYIPRSYYAQIQAQIYCSGAKKAYLGVYIKPTYFISSIELEMNKFILLEVKEDKDFIVDMIFKCKNFKKFYNKIIQNIPNNKYYFDKEIKEIDNSEVI